MYSRFVIWIRFNNKWVLSWPMLYPSTKFHENLANSHSRPTVYPQCAHSVPNVPTVWPQCAQCLEMLLFWANVKLLVLWFSNCILYCCIMFQLTSVGQLSKCLSTCHGRPANRLIVFCVCPQYAQCACSIPSVYNWASYGQILPSLILDKERT